MRGLLFAMMRQVHKVEQFKKTQCLLHCLHAKYNTETGNTVVADNAWGHLQIDATSIFLLSLAQMTVSGLHIIYTLDEVQFIQNLVFYIERGYRTPDYGIWERGNKTNHGTPELNCSSIGMVVAALQAINGINLFGSRGGSSSVIHVLPDEIIRNYTTLHSALPRESPSKEIDAALLAVISFPAFAVADKALVDRTRSDIIKKLGGKYGCKRFLRDGHQTVLEDASRLHYDPHELKIFEDVESEWPLFFTYLILDGLFNNDAEQVKKYRDLLEPCLVDSEPNPDTKEVFRLVPELFIVPADKITAEKENPGSQERIPNENVPLVWAQSLFILGNLINDDLLSTADIDPLALRNSSQKQRAHADTVVQIVLISDSLELQQKLLMYGLETQTVENCEPITISKPSCLREAFSYLGANKKLGLSGRPDRPIGTLSSCKVYRCQGRLYAFMPHFMDREEFYLVSDNNYLVSLFEQEIASLRNHWMQTGRPTMVVILNNEMLGNIDRDDSGFLDQGSGKRNLLNFLISIKSTQVCNGTRVRVGRLSEMVNTACVESLDFLVTSKASKFDLILKGNREGAEVSKLNHSGDADSKLRKRSSVHRVVRPSEDSAGALSPLTKALGNSPALEVFALQEDIQPQNDTAEYGPLLSVKLGNPEHALAAIELLQTTITLFDQIDLLQYLFSCYGGSYFIKGLASLNELMEEVYAKAMQAKLWSIVRTAAGILKKNVNSLTSNLADLLIRQKTVSVGLRPKEHFITSPQNPHDLSKIIYEYWYFFLISSSDIREGPMIQELITYMGSLIRSTPQLFKGIMRIRTHFFLIAMREEISRAMRCNEEDAIEHLFRVFLN
jgi:phosphorylase kinase alpha/beta subunit